MRLTLRLTKICLSSRRRSPRKSSFTRQNLLGRPKVRLERQRSLKNLMPLETITISLETQIMLTRRRKKRRMMALNKLRKQTESELSAKVAEEVHLEEVAEV